MSDAEKILLGFFLGLIGTTFGAILNHIFGNRRHRQGIISNAVTEYKKSFAKEISAISNNSFAMDTFGDAFERHEAAVDVIRPIIPERYQRKLQKAWDDYCGNNNGLGMSDEEFMSAMGATNILEDKKLFNDFKKRFHRLHNCLDGLL